MRILGAAAAGLTEGTGANASQAVSDVGFPLFGTVEEHQMVPGRSRLESNPLPCCLKV